MPKSPDSLIAILYRLTAQSEVNFTIDIIGTLYVLYFVTVSGQVNHSILYLILHSYLF